MYLSIKAFSKESYIEFYKLMGGTKDYMKSKLVEFDRIDYNNVTITFYSNLTILFNGSIDDDLKKQIEMIIDKELYVGSDEVGVGESIGPMVACALKFKDFDSKVKVIMNGIKDSKKLTAAEVSDKAKFIKEHSEFYTIMIEPSKFNEIYKKNPNVKAINALMQNELHKKFEGKGYKHVTDQFVNENKYKEYISESNNSPFNGELLLLTKAEEKYLEVSAAAIISKDIFNNWVLDMLKNDGIDYKIEKRLDSWNLYKLIEEDKLKVKDKSLYIKKWK